MVHLPAGMSRNQEIVLTFRVETATHSMTEHSPALHSPRPDYLLGVQAERRPVRPTRRICPWTRGNSQASP